MSVLSRMRVLVTGANGYVGGRVVPQLIDRGHTVRCRVRDPSRLQGRTWVSQAEVVRGDVLDAASLAPVLAGVDVAYYLVHSLGAGADFHDRDLRRLFSDAPEHARSPKASRMIHRIRRDVRRLVSEATGSYQYTIDRVIEDMITRADELNLRVIYPEARTKLDFMLLLTVQTMNYLHSGRHRLAL